MAIKDPPDTAREQPWQPPDQQGFQPYIAPEARLREFTPLPLIVGTLLGVIFGTSSLYLVLKVGMTVSASIPVAVISITLFRLLSKAGLRNATILEHNIVQTAGSAGESIAFGVGITMPAILILGFDLEVTRVLLVAVLGACLGILMMIPLRRALIVRQHRVLKYPEGTACAEVLKAGASEESKVAATTHHAAPSVADSTDSGGRTVFMGFGIGAAYVVLMEVLKGWKSIPQKLFGPPLTGGSIGMEVSPALLGGGYIIGPRIASIMCAGGVLAYLVLIPAIKFFGAGLPQALAPGTIPIDQMPPNQVRGAYVLYIGAGAVAAGGIISLFRSLPIIWSSLRRGLQDLQAKRGGAGALRTDRDLSMRFVIGGIVLLTAAIVLFRTLHMNVLGAVLIIAFGFLFVTVSSRLTGEIGSSSNPISGMTVATLLLTCLIFLLVGWTGPIYYVTALSVGAIVCIAASNGGATSQDLKTGYLLGATPRYQQIAILVGALASALVMGPVLLQLNRTSTVYVPAVTFAPAKAAPALDTQDVRRLPPWKSGFNPADQTPYHLLDLSTPATRPSLSGLEKGQYLVDDSGRIAYRLERNFLPDLRAPSSELGAAEQLQGPQASSDSGSYRTWQKTDNEGGSAGKYLVNEQDVPVYLVDPGINGVHDTRPDGSTVTKYDSPKATLVSYIIKGILNHQLPWGLVLLGVMIAVVLELAGIPSLAFAVGVYLPLSASSPIFVGGLIRRLVDGDFFHRKNEKGLPTVHGDQGPGVLLASGYIAGGAIAGIVIAVMAGVLGDVNRTIESWASDNNPLFAGPYADLLSLLPFTVIALLLPLVGRKKEHGTDA
jgi:putative OPT family oligopeptide transporter